MTSREVIDLELFSHRFAAIAAEMGERLRRTALSTNVKERLDFSCALLDASGHLVVNAPHVPVHLGALGLCVRRVRAALDVPAGAMVVTNHPAYGGSHLPDVTVIAPVSDGAGELLGWVANRAHHAEIGGRRPGSMPPDATRLAEEGVVVPPLLLVEDGVPRWERVRELLAGGRWPSRAIEENLADLAAAVAANHRGAEALGELARSHGADVVRHFMGELRRHAAARLRAAIRRLPPGERAARQELDDGSPLAVRVTVAGERLTLDFSGSAGVHPGNLNATPAVVRSVVLYVLRLLVDEPLPLNEGLLDPVKLVIPRGILSPSFGGDPARAPAVVGGNVETSQRLADTLLEAFGLLAGSQGTMNNLLFGNQTFGYYETIAGGAGAGPDFPGADGVHTHMTNTRITDAEVLEHRYPVRLERFALRAGSGGRGAQRGGDGVVREMTFLAPVSVSILSQRRREGARGMAGGGPGAPGAQRVVRAGGRVEELPGCGGFEAEPGDRLVVETPGGAGWGPPDGQEELPFGAPGESS